MTTAYHTYKAQVLGVGTDMDNFAGWQCWDDYARYCRFLGVPYANTNVTGYGTGYAEDLWTERLENGILNYFDEVSVMEPGDIAIFKRHPWTPLSHVATFDSDIDGTYGWFLGQNQGSPITHPAGGSATNLVKLPYEALFPTAFRIKAKPVQQANHLHDVTAPSGAFVMIPETGTFTVGVSAINVRNSPDTKGQAVATYVYGQVINYDHQFAHEGYLWISYISGSGVRRYVATGPCDDQGNRPPNSIWGWLA